MTGSVVTQRCALLADQLSSYRHQKLKRKLPADVQLLECAQEDLKVKKALVTQMDKMDQMFMSNMSQMPSNMAQLSSAIVDGFGMLRGLLLPGQQTMYPPMVYSTQLTHAFQPLKDSLSTSLANNPLHMYQPLSSSQPMYQPLNKDNSLPMDQHRIMPTRSLKTFNYNIINN